MKNKLLIILIIGLVLLVSFGCIEEIPEENCAKEGERYSDVFIDKYPEHCCEGLTEWYSGMAFRISIGDKCYETVVTGGAPFGTCINCGNGICEDIEDICNCPKDCSNGENLQYLTAEEFCKKEWENWKGACSTSPMEGFPICNLCKVSEDFFETGSQQIVYSVDYVLNKASLFMNKYVCVDGIIRESGGILYIIDEKDRRWIIDILEEKRIKLSKQNIVIGAKYLICGKFSKDNEYQISVSTFTLGGSNRKTNITEEISKLCYYLIPNACIPESPKGCGMGWATLPLRKPNPCKEDIDCINLGPSYKNWTIDEVKCELDNRKACINDEDCVLGGTCCYIKACYNKDYWTDYYSFNCKGLDCELQKDLAYPYSGCKCVNNYCEEILESQE